MNDLLVFTCNYGDLTQTALLRRSCELVNIDLQIFGGGGWPGYRQGKLVRAIDFLKTRTEPFALYTDGHDSIVLHDAAVILDKFQRIGTSIVVSAEKNCWPDARLAGHYPYPQLPFHNSPWKFINAGGWMGNRLALIEFLSVADTYNGDNLEDDQRCWTDAFLYNHAWRPLIHVDAGCRIFQTMGGVGGHELGPNGENLITHQFPSVLHFNGRTPNIGLWYRTLTGDLGWKGN